MQRRRKEEERRGEERREPKGGEVEGRPQRRREKPIRDTSRGLEEISVDTLDNRLVGVLLGLRQLPPRRQTVIRIA